MIADLLKSRLEPVRRRQRRWRLGVALTLCWTGGVLLGLGLLGWRQVTGWTFNLAAQSVAAVALLAAMILWRRLGREEPDWAELASRIEKAHPELQALLLTAVEQQPDARTGQFNYFQDRLLREALAKALEGHWAGTVSSRRLAGIFLAHAAALAAFALVLTHLLSTSTGAARAEYAKGVSVSPGDTVIEQGSGLVVLARFTGRVPAEATLVVGAAPDSNQRQPLVKNLADPVFGGSLLEVRSNLVYHVEYDGQRTRDFNVRVFEYPRLERADAQITYPPYTGLPPKRIENTRRFTVLEGSRLELAVQLNKPVATARLMAKDQAMVPLIAQPAKAGAVLTNFLLEASRTYELQLIDAEGRTNKTSAQFVFEVATNQRPEIKLVSPRGDQQVTPLEEVPFRAEVSDDIGLRAYGLGYTLAGKETRSLDLGNLSGPHEKRQFNYLLALEELAVAPDQLLSFFIWADDFDPAGQVRRTSSDLYFAEIRPFEQIFRKGQSADADSSAAEQAAQNSPGARLAELEKQIMAATWKLQNQGSNRPPTAQYSQDTAVVRDSQAQALEQARTQQQRTQDSSAQGALEAAAADMSKALAHLKRATNAPAALAPALAAEQSAYQNLLKLQDREFQVARSRSRGQGNQGMDARSQRQLDQLEFASEENRYETQRQAASPPSAEQQEQSQVLRRLKELAQRQQDWNERLKELQTALQEAKTAAERDEISRRLKRLREEEQQMLADIDELRQRMERPANQSRLADARRDLDQTRSDVNQAAEALDQNSVPQALTSGVRAERQLQQMRENLRQQNSSQFADDMRQLRTAARELAQRQGELGNRLQNLAEPQRKTLETSQERTDLAGQFTQQRKQVTNLLDQASQITQQAEAAEPLLARKLYDTVRKSQQEKTDNTLDLAAELLRRSFLPQAAQFEQRARQNINDLKQGIESAAESVLGDETEALRQARRQIDELLAQAEKEGAQSRSNAMSALVNTMAANAANATNAASAANRTTNAPALGANAAGESPVTNLASANSRRSLADNNGQRSQTDNNGQRSQTDNNGQRSPADNDSSRPAPGQNRAGSGQQRRPGQPNDSASDRASARPRSLDPLFNSSQNGDPGGGGPITGSQYADWSERLRDVQEMLDEPEWRNQVARVRDRAQSLRMDFKRLGTLPEWTSIQSGIVQPLAEVRSRINDELARRASRDSLVPLDRDPVPNRYSELVRRYYEQLGNEK